MLFMPQTPDGSSHKKTHHFQRTLIWIMLPLSFLFCVYLMHLLFCAVRAVHFSNNFLGLLKVLLCTFHLFIFTRQLCSMAHAIPFAIFPCIFPMSNYFHHKYNCRQVFPCDSPSATWNCKITIENIQFELIRTEPVKRGKCMKIMSAHVKFYTQVFDY